MNGWGVQWHSKNRLDGDRRYLLWSPIFHTRRKAQEWIDTHYGYIRERPDLRREPHGWRMPKAVRVKIVEGP